MSVQFQLISFDRKDAIEEIKDFHFLHNSNLLELKKAFKYYEVSF